jgi:aspartate aminotransferase
MKIARRAADLPLSVTLALDARAKELAASGASVVNMAVGEPDFPAPAVARRAAIAKIESGLVRYTAAAGTAELRETIARHLSATRDVRFTAAEVVVCHSAKHALANALLALVEPGDEVLVPLPAWVSYVELVRLAQGVPVEIPPAAPTTAGRIDIPGLAAAAAGGRARGIMINSPCNPSGYVMTRAETEAVARIASEHDLWILSDEIYRRLVYDGATAVSPTTLDPATRARTIVVDGASKAFAMTGYRIGYLAAPVELANAVTRLQSQMTGAPNAVSQAAFGAALAAEPVEIAEMVAEFDRRRRFLQGELARLGLEGPDPRGAFYAFPSVARFCDERGSVGFCADLLDEENLALVPGSAFGMPEHVRLSYATDLETIAEAVRRLESFLAKRR